MPDSFRQTEANRNTYIPPEVSKAISQHYDQTMPSHLKSYVSSNTTGYMPEGMKTTLSSQLKKDLPAHLQGYSDAYLEQSIATPMLRDRGSLSSGAHPPVPDALKRDHSIATVSQHSVSLDSLPKQTDQLFTSDAPSEQPSSQEPYDFILNPQSKHHKSPTARLPGLSFSASRLLLIAGSAFAGVIVLAVIVNVLKSPGNLPEMTAVAQDQTEMAHLSSEANESQSLSPNYSNFVVTSELTLSSSTNQLEHYLAINGQKISAKKLVMGESSSISQSLSAAQANGNYSQVFDQTMQSQINNYASNLRTAYKATKGVHGRALLANFYNQAVLLNTQLDQASTP
ncbi:MAG TPA: hypothetical protein VL989_01630 [Candidatus Sulfotelmatobacter sp.]|nr:hypothetical protein [Candidatus Sulfotelmatobacter sp.]